jgi:hypothetical protein
MKLLVLLVGMALAAWLVVTQLQTKKSFVGVDGAPQGTPQQVLDQTRVRAKQIEADAQKRVDHAAQEQLNP